MKCRACNGTGSVLAINGGRWPGLSSTVAASARDAMGLAHGLNGTTGRAKAITDAFTAALISMNADATADYPRGQIGL